ncbi:hypothetical protein ABPG75_011826 [Micractinium tetrahymenae]
MHRSHMLHRSACKNRGGAGWWSLSCGGSWWRPQRFNPDGSLLKFNYILSESTITYVPGVQVYIFDLDIAADTIPVLRQKNSTIRTICYFSTQYEEWRADASQFKASDLGKPLDGWPGERWVDIRSANIRTIMRNRLARAKAAGCDGVDPDNTDGYAVSTGFPLTASDALAFLTFLSTEAHAAGLGIGLKNSLSLINVSSQALWDWAINEQCWYYNECRYYRPFDAIKPIFGVEYCDETPLDPGCFCARANATGYDFLLKRLSLGNAGITCAQYCRKYVCAAAATCPSVAANCGKVPAAPLI